MAGHVTKRKRGDKIRWRARYPDPTKGGTAQIERTFDRKAEAERWLNEQRVAVQRGTHIDPKDTERRFIHLVEAWRTTWIELEPKTKAGYESILNKHVLPRWRNARVGAVSTDAIQAWVNELAKSGRAPSTITHIHNVMRGVMRVAAERHYITVNPCDAVRLPRRSAYGSNGIAKEMLVLTAAEVELLAEAITPHYRVLIYTAAYSGLRAGELGALRRRDVDLLHGSIRVERALKEISTTSENVAPDERGLIFGDTKTGKSRTVGIPSFLVAMLTEHLEAIPADPDALVFTAPEGGPHRHDNFRKRHFIPAVRKRYCSACGERVRKDAKRCPECRKEDLRFVLPVEKHGLRFHDLRHTCATLLIAANAHPKAIQDHLGHKDIQTTFNRYGHLYPSMQRAMAAALDSAYEGGAEPDELPRIGRAASPGRTLAGRGSR